MMTCRKNIWIVWIASLLVLLQAVALAGGSSPAIVDEPEGLYSNIGGTLWHYRRNPQLIAEFHEHLRQLNHKPSDLLSPKDLEPPKSVIRLLIEPEKLTNLPEGDWSITSWADASAGGGLMATPAGARRAYVPLRLAVPRAGTYRLWLRHYSFADSPDKIGLRIYPAGEQEPLPLLNVWANELPVKEAGWYWSSYLVDLPDKPLELRIQNPGWGENPRRVDCLYLTSECWREAPSLEELAAVWQAGKPGSWPVFGPTPENQVTRPAYQFQLAQNKAVRVQELPLGRNQADRQAWAWWMVRPTDWEMRDQYPKLFEASYQFWRHKLEELSQDKHKQLPSRGRKRGPDPQYKLLSRQVIFDDNWNLIGNPVMVAQQIKRIINSYPQRTGRGYVYHWLEAEKFKHIDSTWQRTHRSGDNEGCLRPAGDEVQAMASQELTLDKSGRYTVWLRSGILGDSYSPLRVQVSLNGKLQLAKELFDNNYTPDHGSDWTWHKIAVVKGRTGQQLKVQVTSIPKSQILSKVGPGKSASARTNPKSFYRWIEAEDLETIGFDWGVRSRPGNSGDKCVGMGVDATGGAGYAAQEIPVDKPGEYYLWIRKGISPKKYSPLRVIMLAPGFGPPKRRTTQRGHSKRWLADNPGWAAPAAKGISNMADIGAGTMARRDLVANDYQPDRPGNWTWQRIGPLKVNKPGNIRLEIHRRHYPYIYQNLKLTDEIRRQLGSHYFDCLVLTNDPAYRPQGIYKPRGSGILYLRPAVDSVLVTDNLHYQPRGTNRAKLNLPGYLRRAASLGTKPSAGYLLWTDNPHGKWGSNDWPKVNPSQSGSDRIRAVVPRDMVWASSIRLRGLGDKPIRLEVDCGLLRGSEGQVVDNQIEWRVVARIAPEWAQVPLLRRPFIVIPPYQTASIWLTFDLKGLKPGTYRSTVNLTTNGLPIRRVPVEIKIAEVAIAPRQPILLDGWHLPYPGLVYKQDFKDHGINVGLGYITSKIERQRWGYRMVKYNMGELSPRQDKLIRDSYRRQLARMRNDQVGFDECIWRDGDEPSGLAGGWVYRGKVAKEIDPRIRISYNPGSRAGVETFKALDPYCSVWYPYIGHLNFPDRVAVFAAKPYLFYTIHCGGGSRPNSVPQTIYHEIRSVPARPGNCLGMGIYTVRRWESNNPWDTAYSWLPYDEGVFMYPSRRGPVPSRTWEAIRDASQHANLAKMLKEKASELGLADHYAKLVAQGSVEQLVKELEVSVKCH